MDERSGVFISYAWDGGLEKKEWLREDAVDLLSCHFDVFWDRDSIAFGESVDREIEQALRRRPTKVFCIIDDAYIESANREGSGLRRELEMMESLQVSEALPVLPVIISSRCKALLPASLAGKAYLDLSSIYDRGLRIGPALLELAFGASQAELGAFLARTVRVANVRDAAAAYFDMHPQEFFGNGKSHLVTDIRQQPLLPPAWMLKDVGWSRMLGDQYEAFWPSRGIWDWNRGSVSRGVMALATASLAGFFPHRRSVSDRLKIERGGIILAESFFSFIKDTEPFELTVGELLQAMLATDDGLSIMEHLFGDWLEREQRMNSPAEILQPPVSPS